MRLRAEHLMLDDAEIETWRCMGGVRLSSMPVIQGLSNVIQKYKDEELVQVHKALQPGLRHHSSLGPRQVGFSVAKRLSFQFIASTLLRI